MTHPFMDWVAELDDQKQKFDANPKSAERLTETREAGDRRGPAPGDLQGVQRRRDALGGHRPDHAPAVQRQGASAYISQRDQEGPRGQEPARPGPDRVRRAQGRSTPTGTTSRCDQRHDPGEDAKFDEKFSAWLRDSSVWVPLKVLLKAKPEDLVEAGFPEAEVKAFLTAFHELEQAEDRARARSPRPSAARHAGQLRGSWARP